jgi:hypothetical protein
MCFCSVCGIEIGYVKKKQKPKQHFLIQKSDLIRCFRFSFTIRVWAFSSLSILLLQFCWGMVITYLWVSKYSYRAVDMQLLYTVGVPQKTTNKLKGIDNIVIKLVSPMMNTKQRVGQTHAPGYTTEGIWCLGGVNISCLPNTPSVYHQSSSGKWSTPLSESVCQERLSKWYETRHTAFDPMKVDSYDEHSWQNSECVEIPCYINLKVSWMPQAVLNGIYEYLVHRIQNKYIDEIHIWTTNNSKVWKSIPF